MYRRLFNELYGLMQGHRLAPALIFDVYPQLDPGKYASVAVKIFYFKSTRVMTHIFDKINEITGFQNESYSPNRFHVIPKQLL